MKKKIIIRGVGLCFIVFLLFVGFVFFVYHFNTTGPSALPNPEYPMLYSPIRKIILDTPVAIKALGLEVNESYAVQYSRAENFLHNWTAYGEEYNFVIKFEYKHKIGDYVFLYLYTNNQIIDTLSFQVEEVNG